MSFVGKKFPNITVKVIDKFKKNNTINIFEYVQKHNQKVLLFWYPKDFTFVCPTELHLFEELKSKFEERNCSIIGASCDTIEVHAAWLNIEKNNGGIQGISYPIISDCNRNLSSALGILDGIQSKHNKDNDLLLIKGDNVTYRATYLINEKGVIFHESINDMPFGRNINEYLRLIDSYIHFEKYGEVCPANWEKGRKGLIPSLEGILSFFRKK